MSFVLLLLHFFVPIVDAIFVPFLVRWVIFSSVQSIAVLRQESPRKNHEVFVSLSSFLFLIVLGDQDDSALTDKAHQAISGGHQ